MIFVIAVLVVANIASIYTCIKTKLDHAEALRMVVRRETEINRLDLEIRQLRYLQHRKES